MTDDDETEIEIECDCDQPEPGTVIMSNKVVPTETKSIYVLKGSIATSTEIRHVYFQYTGIKSDSITIDWNTQFRYSIKRIQTGGTEMTVTGFIENTITPQRDNYWIRLVSPRIIKADTYEVGDFEVKAKNATFEMDRYEIIDDEWYIKYGNYLHNDETTQYEITADPINTSETIMKICGYTDKNGMRYSFFNKDVIQFYSIKGTFEIPHGKVVVTDGLYLNQGETLKCESLIIA